MFFYEYDTTNLGQGDQQTSGGRVVGTFNEIIGIGQNLFRGVVAPIVDLFNPGEPPVPQTPAQAQAQGGPVAPTLPAIQAPVTQAQAQGLPPAFTLQSPSTPQQILPIILVGGIAALLLLRKK